MQDDLERAGESPSLSSSIGPGAAPSRLEMLDVTSAIASAERATGSRVFGDPVDNGDFSRAVAEAWSAAEKGERVALVAPAERLASVREALRTLAAARVGIVAHAISGHGGDELSALCDLGWGVLCASGPEDSFDLTLVARRAAEDASVPFIVVHGLGRAAHPAGRAVAMVALPPASAIQSFVGARTKIEGPRTSGRPGAGAGDRAFAERVPFALGSALREYGTVSGRRQDSFDKIPLGESPLVIVGTGPVGDALFCATGELRARGYDVGAVHLTALRPFPGPRLVKALARALAVTVLEPADEPFAHGSFLARDLKSAFTDALTWVPGFPGIGRIPKLFVGASGSAFDVADLAAVCENMLADERGRRSFSFIDVEHSLPRAHRAATPSAVARPPREIAIRLVLDDIACAEEVLGLVGSSMASGIGLRAHGIITATTPPGGAVIDIVGSRDHARGGMARRPPQLVIATERGLSSAGAVSALHEGAILAVLGVDPSGILPEAVRTVVRERRARVLPLALGDGGGLRPSSALASVISGAVLAAASRALRTPLEPGAAARAVGDGVAAPDADAVGQRARSAFESARELLASSAGSPPDTGRPIGVA
jgi:pyruvate-ferredoxin/flavodoxin oxidoreductase